MFPLISLTWINVDNLRAALFPFLSILDIPRTQIQILAFASYMIGYLRNISSFSPVFHHILRFGLCFYDISMSILFSRLCTSLLFFSPPYQVVALNTQLKYFKKLDTLLKKRLGEKEAKKLLSKAVYLTSVGSNDYLFRFTSNSSVYSPKEYVNLVIGNFTNVIKVNTISALYKI